VSDSEKLPNNGNATAPTWRLLLVTVAILSVVYFPLWLGRIVFYSDVAHWTLPARWFVRDSLLRGELPGWNPFQGIGFPFSPIRSTGFSIRPIGSTFSYHPTGWPAW